MERQFSGYGGPRGVPMFDAETLNEVRQRTLWVLIGINSAVLVISGTLGYLLAGKTLKPIEDMVGKQKRFISNAAHEIKTPLTAMKTNLEVTLRDKDLTVADSRKAFTSTIEEVDKLSKFTNRLLQQSKYQNGLAHYTADIDLEKLLQKVVERLKPLADKKSQTFEVRDGKALVKGDRDELSELFTNLIENAVKYSETGQTIKILLSVEKSCVLFMVEDSGKGINKEDLSHIFEPFYRADKSRTDSGNEGYGLGLAISKEIVHRHKGHISVESVRDKGSKFIVRLPKPPHSA